VRSCHSVAGRVGSIAVAGATAVCAFAGAAAFAESAGASAASGAAAQQAAAAGAAAQQAAPATIRVAESCYVNTSTAKRAQMTVTGSGFVPGGTVQLSSSDGTVKATTTATVTGAIAVTTPAPDPSFALPGQQTVTLTAQQPSAPGALVTATTPVTVAPLSVAIMPAQAQPTQRVTWFFSGFEPGRAIYGHYLRRHQVALERFGPARGACGLLKVKAFLYPGGRPRYRLYGLQLDDSRRYRAGAAPRIDKKLQFAYVPAPYRPREDQASASGQAVG